MSGRGGQGAAARRAARPGRPRRGGGGPEAGTLATRLAERGTPVTLVAAERPKGVPESVPAISGVLAAARGDGAIEQVLLADGAAHECRMLCIESPRIPLI